MLVCASTTEAGGSITWLYRVALSRAPHTGITTYCLLITDYTWLRACRVSLLIAYLLLTTLGCVLAGYHYLLLTYYLLHLAACLPGITTYCLLITDYTWLRACGVSLLIAYLLLTTLGCVLAGYHYLLLTYY